MKHLTIIALLFTGSFTASSVNAQINKKLASQLKAIYNNDQQYRVAASREAKVSGWESPKVDSLMRLQDAADESNLTKVEAIIAKYGYPGKALVDKQAGLAAFYVIQHSNQQAQEKYLPLLTQAAEKGDLPYHSLALLIDRVRTGRKEKQVYGTQLHQVGNVYKIFPIEDEPNVDKRRAKAGLEPLAFYMKQWGINYTLPTAGKPNPSEWYETYELHEANPVEAIGGDEAIFAAVKYPDAAKEKGITGTVTVEFTVDKDGNTKDITIAKGLGYGCDEEATRVIKQAKYVNKTGADSDIRMKLPFPYVKK